jgi:ArsR family transcriptional regulator
MSNEYIRVFRAFTDDSRVRVLELLCDGEQCACVLLDDLKISQPTLSHHMKILCDAGVVNKRRVGKWSYYSIDKEGCAYAKRMLDAVARHKLPWTLQLILALRRFMRRLRKGDFAGGDISVNADGGACCAQDKGQRRPYPPI